MTSAPEATSERPAWQRLVLVALLLVALFVIAKLTGVLDRFDPEGVRAAIESAGAWGWLLYLLIFILGELVQVPGMIFVAASVYVYGTALGAGLALLGGFLSVCVSFVLVRRVAGHAIAEIRAAWVQKILAGLDRRPILTIALLRLLLWLSPPVNYALAMSKVGFRDYAIGSAIGLTPPILLASLVAGGLLGSG